MGMPDNLVLVRHGHSEGNLATEASKVGDNSFYTPEFLDTPGHQWRLTQRGQIQAQIIGAWVNRTFSGFDQHYVSPYVRTRETAGNMGLSDDPQWRMNRSLRERDWADIGNVTKEEFRTNPVFALNYANYRRDPLYWTPPNGESIATVAENRVRNFLSTLHREADRKTVLAVTHAELMWAFRLMVERWNDEQFVQYDKDKSMKIHNCQAIWYTRLDPFSTDGSLEVKRSDRLTWVRTATPVEDEAGNWDVEVSDWSRFERPTMTSQELLESVDKVSPLFR